MIHSSVGSFWFHLSPFLKMTTCSSFWNYHLERVEQNIIVVQYEVQRINMLIDWLGSLVLLATITLLCIVWMLCFIDCDSVGRSLVYHLSELKGMSLWYDKYGVIGLSPPAIQGKQNNCYIPTTYLKMYACTYKIS